MLNAFWWARKVLETNTDIKDLLRTGVVPRITDSQAL